MFLSKSLHFIKIFLFSKWFFRLPKKKKILVYDGIKNPFIDDFSKKLFNVYYRRGEELNIIILLKCLITFNLSTENYFRIFLSYAKPKIIISAVDSNYGFFFISKKYNIKTILVQSGAKTFCESDLRDKKIFNKKNKKIFYVDYIFVFNKHTANLYDYYVSGKKIIIGSYKNNQLRIKRNAGLKKKEILFISSYKSPEMIPRNKQIGKYTYGDLYKNDASIIKWLANKAKIHNLKFNILGRNVGKESKKEKKYYDSLLKNHKYTFIRNFKGTYANYLQVYRYKFVFTIDSTLGIENFVNYGRTGFIFNRPFVYPIKTRRFGGIEFFNRKGSNWTSYNNKTEFNRVFEFVVNSKLRAIHSLRNKYFKKIMNYDLNNKKFKKIIKKILK